MAVSVAVAVGTQGHDADDRSNEDSEVIEVVVRAHRRVIKRKRYKPTCKCPDQPGIITAPNSPKLIPKSSLGVNVGAPMGDWGSLDLIAPLLYVSISRVTGPLREVDQR